MLGFDVPARQDFLGKVSEVRGHDDLGLGPDRGCEDVTIVGVGQLERSDERFVARDEDVTHRGVHEVPSAVEGGWVEVRPVGLQMAEGLVEDLVGPLGLDQPGHGYPDEDVAQSRGVEDVRVVRDGERHLRRVRAPGSWW